MPVHQRSYERAATTVDILNIWSSVCSPAERQTQSTGESRSLYTNLEARAAQEEAPWIL